MATAVSGDADDHAQQRIPILPSLFPLQQPTNPPASKAGFDSRGNRTQHTFIFNHTNGGHKLRQPPAVSSPTYTPGIQVTSNTPNRNQPIDSRRTSELHILAESGHTTTLTERRGAVETPTKERREGKYNGMHRKE